MWSLAWRKWRIHLFPELLYSLELENQATDLTIETDIGNLVNFSLITGGANTKGLRSLGGPASRVLVTPKHNKKDLRSDQQNGVIIETSDWTESNKRQNTTRGLRIEKAKRKKG